MNIYEKIAAFEAKLHDALTDAGHTVYSIQRIQLDPEGYDGYTVNTNQGHATFLVDFISGVFIRVVDLPPGFGA